MFRGFQLTVSSVGGQWPEKNEENKTHPFAPVGKVE
jgi:hypothetical protein